MVSNNSIVFAKLPTEFPVLGEHLVVEQSEYKPYDLKDGELVLKLKSVSVDPYMRGRMRDAKIKSYSPPFELGKPINGGTIGEVVESKSDKFPKGSIVGGFAKFQEYQVVSKEAQAMLKKIDNKHNLPLEKFLGVSGMPGFTAWVGLKVIAELKAGEVLYVNSAAGAVGQLVGLIALKEGVTVIGSAGSDEKVKYLKDELKFTHVFNYKTKNVDEALSEYAPDGLDIYWENVGGEQFEAALKHARPFARFVVCGMISQYNVPAEKQYAVKGTTQIIGKKIKIQGFIQGDYQEKYFGQFFEEIQGQLASGELKYKEDITKGFNKIPDALIGVLKGENFGKAVVSFD